MSPIPADISRLGSGRVLVVGDAMLDHYVTGSVSRVSDEAPVPILRVSGERWTPGGAANVAANIAALGGFAALIGVTGDDAASGTLENLLAAIGAGVDAHIQRDGSRPTTLKTRYMGGQHQIVRVDREETGAISDGVESALLADLRAELPGCGAVVVSDYAKGALTDRMLREAIAAASQAGCPVVVDPKRVDWTLYAGAAVITPNRKELSLATGMACDTDDQCSLAAARAMAVSGAAILLTRSERGMSLYRAGQPPRHMAARAREVFDVSGAGDTVAAAVALGVAAGLGLETAMGVANLAAGVVVGKRGTATATQAELQRELRAGADAAAAGTGAMALADAVGLRARWAAEGLSVGLANGCFDILHAGHVSLIRQAGAACDRLIMALNTDASVKRLKGPSRPAQSQDTRAAVMAAMKGVDAVILFDEDTPLQLIEALQPDVLIKGADYAEEAIVGADIVRAHGGRIVRAELSPGQSTTSVLAGAREGKKD